MPIVGAAPLPPDARAIRLRLEQLAESHGGEPVLVSVNTLASDTRIGRTRAREAMRILVAQRIVTKAQPADPNTGAPASYRVHARQAGDQ